MVRQIEPNQTEKLPLTTTLANENAFLKFPESEKKEFGK
jgi:hypothetical protein